MFTIECSITHANAYMKMKVSTYAKEELIFTVNKNSLQQ